MWSPRFEQRVESRHEPRSVGAPIPRRLAELCLSSVLLLHCGCTALERAHECQSVVEIVNEGVAEVRFEAPDAGSSAPAYERIAAHYETIGKRLEAVGVAEPVLAKALAGYREVLDRGAKHSRDYALELASSAKSKGERRARENRLKRIRSQAKADLTREAVAVRKLNTLCHPQ